MADEGVQRYLDGIESQHKTREKFMSHLSSILEKIDAATTVAASVPKEYHVHDAVGKQLDTTALYVGSDRRFPPVAIPGLDPLMSDTVFRQVVLARIIQNQWDGTEKNFREIWDATIGSELDAVYTDNQDMTISVDIAGSVEPIMVELILAGYIIPKPLGVGMNVSITEKVIADAEAAFHPPAFAATPAYNYGRISLHYPHNSEQQSSDTVMFGGAFYSNYGRITFPVCQ